MRALPKPWRVLVELAVDVAHLVGEVAHAGVVVGDVIGYLIGRSSGGCCRW